MDKTPSMQQGSREALQCVSLDDLRILRKYDLITAKLREKLEENEASLPQTGNVKGGHKFS